MRTLVVYYSRTHNSKKVAENIKNHLQCDIEGIISKTKYNGPVGFVKGAKEAKKGKEIEILIPKFDASQYDCVILGTPVWAGTVSTPMLAYINQNKEKFNKVAFFLTSKTGKVDDVFIKESELVGKKPVNTLNIKESDNVKEIDDKVIEFLKGLEKED
jgi:flavodoxin